MNGYRCYLCSQNPVASWREFDFYGEKPKCPKCGAEPPAVALLTPVHYLVPDAQGPIVGVLGRFHVACDPTRPYLNAPGKPRYSATGEPDAVTCYRCLKMAKIERELVVA